MSAAPDVLARMRRRLEAWELEHLRRLVAELGERVERAEEEASMAREAADQWQRIAFDLQESLLAEDCVIGITKEGDIGVMKKAEERP